MNAQMKKTEAVENAVINTKQSVEEDKLYKIVHGIQAQAHASVIDTAGCTDSLALLANIGHQVKLAKRKAKARLTAAQNVSKGLDALELNIKEVKNLEAEASMIEADNSERTRMINAVLGSSMTEAVERPVKAPVKAPVVINTMTRGDDTEGSTDALTAVTRHDVRDLSQGEQETIIKDKITVASDKQLADGTYTSDSDIYAVIQEPFETMMLMAMKGLTPKQIMGDEYKRFLKMARSLWRSMYREAKRLEQGCTEEHWYSSAYPVDVQGLEYIIPTLAMKVDEETKRMIEEQI